MDTDRFDRWARVLAAPAGRRGALKGGLALAVGGALRVLAPAQDAGARRRRRQKTAGCGGTWDGSSTGGQGNERLAQTFTAKVSGKLTQVRFHVGRQGASGDFVVRIGDVDGTSVPLADAAPLAETRVSDDTLPLSDLVPVIARFGSSAARVAKGRKYALIVTRASSFKVGTHSDGDVCLGDFFHTSSQTTEFNELENMDMLFSAWVV